MTDLTFKHIFTADNPGDITDYYAIDRKMLGEGSYGQVTKGTVREGKGGKSTSTVRAVKAIDLSKISDQKRLADEVAIQKDLDHPNIVKLFEVFKDAKRMYLVMELCTGGELFDRIVEEAEKHADEGKEGEAFDERGASTYMQQILGAMRYLHDHSYVHRDIKPENFLLQDRTRTAPIKVIDFGLAKRFELGKGATMKTKAGTPYYVAPQVLQGKYDEKCDIWSCGVICYILLCGYPPFYGDRDEDILRRVKKGEFDFPSPDWDEISKDGKDFIKKMLTHNPEKRPSAEQLLAHPWFTNAEKATGSVGKDLGTRLRNFTGVSKLKKVALTMIAKQMDPNMIEELKKTFTLLDENRDGTLTMKEILDGCAKHKVDLADDFKKTLESLDTDGSGTIDYTEFIAATMTTKEYMKKEQIWQAFRTFDKDGDGQISKAELKLLLADGNNVGDVAGLEQQIEEMIKEADLDGDGVISWEEFNALMEKGEPAKSVAL
jgi:calcium-dependent protein kinase